MAVTQQIRMEKKAGKPNLEKLLLPTEYHPKGRIQIDPETGQVVGGKNNVIGYKEKIIRHESGFELGRQKISVNGGHVKKEGTVWRMGLGGPTKYHYRVLDDQYRYKARGKQDVTAPELEYEEARDYQDYLEYLKAEGISKEVHDMLSGQKMSPELQKYFRKVDTAFYKSREKSEKPKEPKKSAGRPKKS